MNAVERRQFLTNRPPSSRELIVAKLKEYESFPADQRELRLKATELHWFLLPLLRAPAPRSSARLAAMPAEIRPLVEERLQEWDKLSPEVRKELLANEAVIRYLTDLASSTEQQKSNILKNISAERRQALEAGVCQLQAMPEEQREKLINSFDQFFNLTLREREKALSTLSEPERRQIAKTLQTFEHLPPAQRAACIRSFEKFTQLSLEERQQFLSDAERWKLMPPEQREAWRKLVARLAFHLPPLPRPKVQRATSTLATNQN